MVRREHHAVRERQRPFRMMPCELELASMERDQRRGQMVRRQLQAVLRLDSRSPRRTSRRRSSNAPPTARRERGTTGTPPASVRRDLATSRAGPSARTEHGLASPDQTRMWPTVIAAPLSNVSSLARSSESVRFVGRVPEPRDPRRRIAASPSPSWRPRRDGHQTTPMPAGATPGRDALPMRGPWSGAPRAASPAWMTARRRGSDPAARSASSSRATPSLAPRAPRPAAGPPLDAFPIGVTSSRSETIDSSSLSIPGVEPCTSGRQASAGAVHDSRPPASTWRHAPQGRPPPATARAHEPCVPRLPAPPSSNSLGSGGAEGDMPTPIDLILDDRRQMSVRGTTTLAARAVVHRCRQQGCASPMLFPRAHEQVLINGLVDDARVDVERPEQSDRSPAVGRHQEQRPQSWRRRARGGVPARSSSTESISEREREITRRVTRCALVQARVRGTGCHLTRDGARGASVWRSETSSRSAAAAWVAPTLSGPTSRRSTPALSTRLSSRTGGSPCVRRASSNLIG